MRTPEQAAQWQLDAYNRRDINGFMGVYAEDVQVFRPPQEAPVLQGAKAMREHYAGKRFNLPLLNAQLLNRMVFGNTVIDHERVTGLPEGDMEAAAVYEISAGLIQKVWFFSAK